MTSKDTRIVFYSGIGSKESRCHTVAEFLTIMREEFQDKSWAAELEMYEKSEIVELNFKDWILPDDFCFFTLEDWLEFSGASITN